MQCRNNSTPPNTPNLPISWDQTCTHHKLQYFCKNSLHRPQSNSMVNSGNEQNIFPTDGKEVLIATVELYASGSIDSQTLEYALELSLRMCLAIARSETIRNDWKYTKTEIISNAETPPTGFRKQILEN